MGNAWPVDGCSGQLSPPVSRHDHLFPGFHLTVSLSLWLTHIHTVFIFITWSIYLFRSYLPLCLISNVFTWTLPALHSWSMLHTVDFIDTPCCHGKQTLMLILGYSSFFLINMPKSKVNLQRVSSEHRYFFTPRLITWLFYTLHKYIFFNILRIVKVVATIELN